MASLGKSDPFPSLLERLLAMLTPPRVAFGAALACVVAIFAFMPSGPSSQSRDVAVVASRSSTGLQVVDGTVEVDGVLVDGTVGAIRVESGQRLVVPRGGRVVLAYGDGSRVSAARNADFEVAAEGVLLNKGLLELAVTPSAVGFSVKTPHADVVVRGTSFEVEVGRATRVGVVSGAVAVESRIGGFSIVLRAGDKVSVLPSGRVQTSLVNVVDPPVTTADGAAAHSENTSLGIHDED